MMPRLIEMVSRVFQIFLSEVTPTCGLINYIWILIVVKLEFLSSGAPSYTFIDHLNPLMIGGEERC
jgi:hypothetical protein